MNDRSDSREKFEDTIQGIAAAVAHNKLAAVVVVFDPDAEGQSEVGVAVIGGSPELEPSMKRFAIAQLRRGVDEEIGVLQGVVPEA